MRPTTTTSSVQRIVGYGHISVCSRLLYPYVANDYVPLAAWEDSLHRMAAAPGFIASGYRLLTDSSGAPLLNFKFAKHFAIRASIAPKGAIARVILDEGLKAAECGDTNYINHALAHYGNIGLVIGLMRGRTLHSFLTPKSVFEDWFAQQKQHRRMVYGRDYVRVSESGVATTSLHRKDRGKGEIYFVEAAAERTIMDDPSPRGMLAGEYINNPMPRRNEG
jgi:hypothetical protein